MHAFEGNQKANVLALHHLEGTAGIMGAVEKNGAADGVGNFGGHPLLPGVAAWGADAAGEIGSFGPDEIEQCRQVRGVVLAVSVHHRGERAGAGKEAGVESRPLTEVFRKVDDTDILFRFQQGRGAVAAPVVHGDNFGPRHGVAGLGDDGRHIFLLVIEGDDEGKVGGHGLFSEKQ